MHRTHNSIFENNHVHHIQQQRYSMGIDLDGYGTVEWSHIIRGNHIHDCDQAGIELENTFNSVIENNIVHSMLELQGIEGIGERSLKKIYAFANQNTSRSIVVNQKEQLHLPLGQGSVS